MVNIVKPTNVNDVWSASGVRTMPDMSKIGNGWVVELPPYQTANWIEWKQDQYNAHNNQHGVSVWDAVTEYIGGVSYTKGSNGVVYKCLTTATGVDPTNPLNSAYWVKAFEDFGTVSVVANNLATLSANYTTLAGVTASAARTNLSVYSKAEGDARYAPVAGNASQTFSVGTATASSHAITLAQFQAAFQQATEVLVGVAEIASQGEVNDGTDDLRFVTPLKLKTAYLSKADNLAGLANVATARTNLGLGSIATAAASDYLTKAGNLSGLVDVSAARNNLGLGSMSTEVATNYLTKAGNLSGLASVSAARTNLGLGNSSTRNIGTTVGTTAAGDDSRIVNAVQTSRQLIAGNGLTGGGSLVSDRTITLGTPSTITPSTGNTVSSTSHTHSLDISSLFPGATLATKGSYSLYGGLLLQWCSGVATSTQESQVVTFDKPFSQVFNLQVTTVFNNPSDVSDAQNIWYQVVSNTNNSVTVFRQVTAGGSAKTFPYIFAVGLE